MKLVLDYDLNLVQYFDSAGSLVYEWTDFEQFVSDMDFLRGDHDDG